MDPAFIAALRSSIPSLIPYEKQNESPNSTSPVVSPFGSPHVFTAAHPMNDKQQNKPRFYPNASADQHSIYPGLQNGST